MSWIHRFLLILSIPVALGSSFDDVRARRDLSPRDWRRWLEVRSDVMRYPERFNGNVAWSAPRQQEKV